MDVAQVSNDHHCELGGWLHGDGKRRFGELKPFTDCVEKHRAFHQAAGNVARMINAGRYTEAESLLNGDSAYGAASLAVGTSIMRLRREAGL